MIIALPVVLGIKLIVGLVLVCFWLDIVRFMMVFIPTIALSYAMAIFIVMPMFFMLWLDSGPVGSDLVTLAEVGIVNGLDCLAIWWISRRPYFMRQKKQHHPLPRWVLAVYWIVLSAPVLSGSVAVLVFWLGSVAVLVFWWWVCFRGGDAKWSQQMESFWFHRACGWVQLKHCKMFAWALLLAMVTAGIGLLVNKIIER